MGLDLLDSVRLDSANVALGMRVLIRHSNYSTDFLFIQVQLIFGLLGHDF